MGNSHYYSRFHKRHFTEWEMGEALGFYRRWCSANPSQHKKKITLSDLEGNEELCAMVVACAVKEGFAYQGMGESDYQGREFVPRQDNDRRSKVR